MPTGRTDIRARPGASPAAALAPGTPGWSVLWFALIVLVGILTFDPKLYINGDNVDYIRLAEGVRNGTLWGSPKYPPLFPMLLALPQLFFGSALIPQKVFVFLFFIAAAGFAMRRSRMMLPRGWAEPVAFLAMTMVPVLEYGHYTMSEIPYLLFSLLALEGLDTARSGRQRGILLAAIAAAATFYLRSVGLALWGAVLLGLALDPAGSGRGRRLAAFAAVSIALFLPWILRTTLGPANPYFAQLVRVNPYYPEYGILDAGGWIFRIGENARTYLLGEIPTLLFPARLLWTYGDPDERFLPLPLGIVILAVALVGLAASLRRREASGFYVVAYLVVILLWPAIWTGLRFLVPILPFLMIAFFRGLLVLTDWTGRIAPRPRRIFAAVVAVSFLLAVRNQAVVSRLVREYPQPWKAYFEAAAFLRERAPADAVVLDRKPALLEYATGRRALAFPREKDPAAMLAWMQEKDVNYVLVSAIPYDDIGRYLIPAIQEEQEHFAPVFETEEDSAWYTVVLTLLP